MTITAQEGLQIVLKHIRPAKPIRLPLADAVGLCLAEDVRADRDQPPADRSAMDGYAVRAADLRRVPCELRLVGEVAAGSAARPRVQAGTCVSILTGANVPPGADTVVKIEETELDEQTVTFLVRPSKGRNIRRRGEEATRGAVLLPAGTALTPADIGLCSSVGKSAPKVRLRPSVAVLCTGKEVLTATDRVGTHQLRDSNGPALVATLTALGCRKIRHWIVPDEPKVLTRRLRHATSRYDVTIITGGVSVGRYDYVPEAVDAIGARVRFHGVRMKPGKPQMYATLPGNKHIFGLPGNPLSVLVGCHEFVLPALRRLAGVAPERCQPALQAVLTKPVKAKSGRAEYILGRLHYDGTTLTVEPIACRGSGDLAAARDADGTLLRALDESELEAGHIVEFRPWEKRP